MVVENRQSCVGQLGHRVRHLQQSVRDIRANGIVCRHLRCLRMGLEREKNDFERSHNLLQRFQPYESDC